jgi:hypothetical protein
VLRTERVLLPDFEELLDELFEVAVVPLAALALPR